MAIMCRSLPPAMHFSVFLLEKADSQVPLTRGREVPNIDTHTRSRPYW